MGDKFDFMIPPTRIANNYGFSRMYLKIQLKPDSKRFSDKLNRTIEEISAEFSNPRCHKLAAFFFCL
jgi:hypothetical protein